MLTETQKSLPEIITLFPGISDRVYFQNPETLEYWFQAANVCKVLGFSNPSSALSLHCEDDEKFREVHHGRDTWFVSEAGCYGLAMGAKNDVAKRFKQWLKREVLPKLRAEGGYIMPSATLQQIEGLQSQIDYQKSRLLDASNLHKKIEHKSGLSEHPRLALDAFVDLCQFEGNDSDKQLIERIISTHSTHGNYVWKVQVTQLGKLINEITSIDIPVTVLTYWLAEWGYKIKASGGKRRTGAYSVEMMPLNKSNKLKIAERLKVAI
jgi:prophage antirepressor-like protein